jgi:hypothetical protein
MSDITSDLFAQLTTGNPTPAQSRVWPLTTESPVTAASFPFVTYQTLSDPVENVLNGSPPINTTRFQIDCYDLTYTGATALAKAVVAQMTAWTVANLSLNSPEDFFEDQIRAYRRMLEYRVWHYD